MLLQSVFFTPAGDGFSPPVTGVKLATSLAEPPKLTAPLTTDSASHAGATALAQQNKAVLLRSGVTKGKYFQCLGNDIITRKVMPTALLSEEYSPLAQALRKIGLYITILVKEGSSLSFDAENVITTAINTLEINIPSISHQGLNIKANSGASGTSRSLGKQLLTFNTEVLDVLSQLEDSASPLLDGVLASEELRKNFIESLEKVGFIIPTTQSGNHLLPENLLRQELEKARSLVRSQSAVIGSRKNVKAKK